MHRDTAAHHASNASSLASTATIPPSNGFFSPARRRPSPLSNPSMGQAESTPARQQAELGLSPTPAVPPSPQPTSKYRFGWPGRRKKSEDLTKVMGASTYPGPSPPPTAAPPPPNSLNNTSMGRELARQANDVSSSSSLDSHFAQEQQLQHMHELSRPASRSSAKQLTMQFASNTLTALKGKLNASQASIHSLRTAPLVSPTSPPPPLPPKPNDSRLSSSASSSQSGNSSADWVALDNKPLPSPTPDATAPVTATVETTPQQEIIPTATAAAHDVSPPQRREREHREGADTQTAKNVADDWRKSDSTLRTVRLVGSRTPRPLSLAESTNSGQTVLPTVGAGSPMNVGPGKRLSALITDAEYGVAEVDSEDDEDEDIDSSAPPSAFSSVNSLQQQQAQSASSSWSSSPTPVSGKPQPAHSRSSLSIRIGRFSGTKGRVSEHGHMNGSDSEALSSSVSTRDTGIGMSMHTANSSLTSFSSSSPGAKESRPSIEMASSASIASSMSSERRPEQYAQYKANAKLEPWITLPATNHTALESQASLSTSESASTSSHAGSVSKHADTGMSGLQRPATSQGATLRPAHQRTRLQSIQARGFRQTAVSFTTGLAPAAGFARKAVDRLGRALGGSATSLTNGDADEVNGNDHSHPPSALGANAELLGLVGQKQHPHPHSRRSHHAQQNSHPHLAHGHPPSSAKKAFRRHVANPSSSWSIGSNSNSASDTDGPGGPKLGRRVRGPLMTSNNGKGLVFGRELVLCVQDTACEAGVETDVDGLSLEGRSLPALVVRCAQHIVKWGVQEEGLFRISGRSTHVSKLRTEFDSGADYDLRECGPGEIDPHAVSSILKAYLRELPEPLLTRHLMPYFDAALMAETHMINAADAQSGGNHNGAERVRGQGLPSSPRDSVQVRKAPSLSTFAVPTLSPRAASQTLLHALAALVARLPKENRDLLRTVTELISATARASRETKMPLSNLLLVFCPSLMMSPPLLRVLCEAKEIWDGPLADVQIPIVEEVPSNEKMVEDETEGKNKDGDDEKGLHSQGTIRRSPRTSNEHAGVKADKKEDGTVAPPSLALPSLVLPSDAPSTLNGMTSAVSGHTKTDSSISAPFTLSSPTGLTVSTYSSDSFETPPSSNSSPNVFLAPSASMTKPGLDTAGLSTKVFALRAQSDLPSPLSPCAAKKAVRKSLIGNPVPFPMGLGMSRSSSGNGYGSAGSAPVTPIDLGVSDRLSLTSHSSSSPNLSSRSATGMTPPRLGRRKSKASLLALKSKRSLSSLLGLSQAQAQMQTPQMVVPDRASEDLGSESSPPRRPSTPCPVLDLPVDTSRIGLGLGLSLTDEPKSLATANANVPRTDTLEVPSPTPAPGLRPQGSIMNRAASDSSALTNSVFYTPPTTARALAPAQTLSTASSSSSGSYSFLDFNIGKSDDEEEDWARSVLKAASRDA